MARLDLARPRPDDAREARLRVAVAPSGALLVELAPVTGEEDDDGLSPTARSRIAAAFARGAGHGLLDLGTSEIDAALASAAGLPARDWPHVRHAALRDARSRGAARARRGRVPATNALGSPPPCRRCPARSTSTRTGSPRGGPRSAAPSPRRFERTAVPSPSGCTGAIRRGTSSARCACTWPRTAGTRRIPSRSSPPTRRGLAQAGRVQHRRSAAPSRNRRRGGDRQALLALLVPVQRAAEKSACLTELVDSGEIFHPLAWTPPRRIASSRRCPRFEAAGVVVRVPDWWQRAAPAPPRGRGDASASKQPAGLGVDAMLDFAVALTLDGEPLSAAEERRSSRDRAASCCSSGQWVEVDRRAAPRGARALEGASSSAARARRDLVPRGHAPARRRRRDRRTTPPTAPRRRGVVARRGGPWLDETLAELRGPDGLAARPTPAARCAARCAPTSATGVALALVARPRSARRLPRRRHGARQDASRCSRSCSCCAREGATAPAPRSSCRRRSLAQLARRGRALRARACAALVAHPSAMSAAGARGARARATRRRRPGDHDLRHAGRASPWLRGARAGRS